MKNKLILIEIIILLLLGLTIISWFSGNYFIKNVDSFFGFNPNAQSYENRYIWQDRNSIGFSQSNFELVLMNYFQAFLVKLFGIYIFQKIFFYLMFTMAMLAFWIFCFFTISSTNDLKNSTSRVLSSIFYASNTFTMSYLWWHHMLLIFFWIAFPLVILFIHKIIKSKSIKKVLIYLLALSFIFFIIGPAFIPITLIVLTFYILITILILKLLKKSEIKIKNLIIAGIIIFLINFWYLFPYINTLNEQATFAGETMKYTSEEQYLFQSNFTQLINELRLMGFFNLYQKLGTDYYYYWNNTYLTNIFMIFLTFIVPFISLLILIKDKSKSCNELIIISFVSLVLAMFLQKQGSVPFSNINNFLFQLPFGSALRHAYDKFAIIVVFSLSILMSYSLLFILNLFKKKSVIAILSILFTALIFTYSYPIWNGEVIYSGGDIIPSHKTIIPQEYYEWGRFMDNISRNQTFVRIAILPSTFHNEAALNWESGIQPNSDPLMQYFLDNKFSLIQNRNGNVYNNIFITDLESYLLPYNESINDYLQLLSLAGTRYLVFHKDWDDNFISYLPKTEYYEEMIRNCSNTNNSIIKIKMIYSNSKLSVYELYNSSNFITTNNEETFITSLKRKNPVNWELDISTKDQINLTFRQAYDHRWEAIVYKDGKKIYTIPSSLDKKYFNSFYINETGNLKITLYFKPQSYFYIGLIISIITFICCLIYIIYNYFINRKAKKELNS